MTKTFQLPADMRQQLGSGIKQLRRDGKIPATLYGKGIENLTLAVDARTFAAVYNEAGTTQLVEVAVAGQKHTVLIHAVQIHPVEGTPLHIEFFQVNLREKMKSTISVRIVGEAPAVAQNLGTLLTPTQTIDVESYPQDIPEALEVDVSSLTELDQAITVADIKAPAGVAILSEPDGIVAKIGAIVVEEEPAIAPAEGEAAEGEAGETTPTSDEATGATTEEKAAE